MTVYCLQESNMQKQVSLMKASAEERWDLTASTDGVAGTSSEMPEARL